MKELLRNFREETQEALLDLLWRQWCSLGVAGNAKPANPDYLIDPEALILATSSIGVLDPRLFDEALDWLASYGALINLQRLKNIQKASPFGDEQVISAMADWLSTHATQPRWKALVSRKAAGQSPRVLFVEAGNISPRFTDETFSKFGLIRGCFEIRGMGRPPDPSLLPNLLLSMRALIGVSARAEVILYLAGGTPTHASELARATQYAPRTMQTLLQEMSLSGHLFAQQSPAAGKIRKGANRRFSVQSRNWSFLTDGAPFPTWFLWPNLFNLGKCILDTPPADLGREVHSAVIASKLRDAVSGYQESMHYLKPDSRWIPQNHLSGEDLIRSLAAWFPSSVKEL